MRRAILIFAIIISSNMRLLSQWTLIDTSMTHTNAALRSAYFTDDTTGYVVGGWSGISGVILKTTDAGMTWSLKIVSSDLESVYFPSKDTGYVVGKSRKIMKTIDAGANWTDQFATVVSNTNVASAVVFINNDTGFVGLNNGPQFGFLKTYNGGTTWLHDMTDTIFTRNMCLVKPNKVFAINNKLAQTNNLGALWTDEIIPPGGASNSIFFVNDSVGFATMTRGGGSPCFNYGTYIKTINRGQTWTVTDYNCGYAGAIYFPSDQIGYMLGDGYKFRKTIDQGDTWNYSIIPYDSNAIANGVGGLYLICTDDNTCYILNNDGTIIKTTNGGGVGISDLAHPSVNDFALYPNPASTNITIEFELFGRKNVALEIKNILGQIVYSENVDLIASKQTNEINISSLSNGVYFIEISSEMRRINKKFIKQ